MKRIFFFVLVFVLMFGCSKFEKKDKVKEAEENLMSVIKPVSLNETPVSQDLLNIAFDYSKEFIDLTKKEIEKNNIKNIVGLSSLKANVYFVKNYKDRIENLKKDVNQKEVKVTLSISDVYLIGSTFKDDLLFSKRIISPKDKEDFNAYYMNYKGKEKLIVKRIFKAMDKKERGFIYITIIL